MLRRIRLTLQALTLTLIATYSFKALADDALESLDLGELLETDLQVVSATKIQQTISESPSVITVITRDDLLKHNIQSLADALTQVTGLYVNQDYTFFDVGVRGISGEVRGASRLLKFMIDGQPMNNRLDTTNYIGPEYIPLEAVERIEVIRGPASALYGANAFLGVVNVVTRTGKELNGSTLSAFVTSFDNIQDHYLGYGVSGATGGALGPFDILASISYQDINRSGLTLPCGSPFDGDCDRHRSLALYSDIFDRESFDDHARPLSLFARVSTHIGQLFKQPYHDLGTLHTSVAYQSVDSIANYADWSVFQYDFALDTNGNLTPITGSNNRIAVTNTAIRLRYEVSLFEDFLKLNISSAYIDGSSSANERLRSVSNVNPSGNIIERSQNGYQSIDLASDIQWIIGEELLFIPNFLNQELTLINNLTLIVGTDVTFDWVRYALNSDTIPVLFTTSELINLGIFAQFTGSLLNRRLGFIAGVRYDDHAGAQLAPNQRSLVRNNEQLCGNRVCYDSINYRLGVTLQLLESLGEFRHRTIINSLYLKALYGTAFKAPAPAFLYEDGYIGPAPFRPSPDLRSQNVRSLELVLGAELFDRILQLTTVFFSNSLDNKVNFAPTDSAVTAVSTAFVETTGFELDTTLRLGPVTSKIGLAYQDSVRIFDDPFSQNIATTFGFPYISGFASVSIHINPIKTHLTLNGQYIGQLVGSPLTSDQSDNELTRYELGSYSLIHLEVRTEPFHLAGPKRPTQFWFSIRNLLDQKYEFPAFQPLFTTDIPGLPRVMSFGLQQKI